MEGALLVLTLGSILILMGVVFWFREQRRKWYTPPVTQVDHRDEKRLPAIYGSSYVPGQGPEQQDCIGLPDGAPANLCLNRGMLFVLCDGVGGGLGGELASRSCAQGMITDFYGPQVHESAEEFFRYEINRMDRMVHGLISPEGALLGAGTTLAACILEKDQLHWANVGDTRIYLLRGSELRQLTRDHHYRLELMENGMSQEDAEKNSQASALISYVGMNGITRMDIADALALEKDDTVLMCTDGLYDSLQDRQIVDIMKQNEGNPGSMARALCLTAMEHPCSRFQDISALVILNRGMENQELNEYEEA